MQFSAFFSPGITCVYFLFYSEAADSRFTALLKFISGRPCRLQGTVLEFCEVMDPESNLSKCLSCDLKTFLWLFFFTVPFYCFFTVKNNLCKESHCWQAEAKKWCRRGLGWK